MTPLVRLILSGGLTLALGGAGVAAVFAWKAAITNEAVAEAESRGWQIQAGAERSVRLEVEQDYRAAQAVIAERERRIRVLTADHEAESRRLEEVYRHDETARAWRDAPLPDAVRGELRAEPDVSAGGAGARDPRAAGGAHAVASAAPSADLGGRDERRSAGLVPRERNGAPALQRGQVRVAGVGR